MNSVTNNIFRHSFNELTGGARDFALRMYYYLMQNDCPSTDILYLISKFELPNEKKDEIVEIINDTKCDDYKDFRIRALRLQAFRKFPVNKKRVLYGISFMEKESPVSNIILGGNGSGKTSLFSALEEVTTLNVSAGKMRGFSNDEDAITSYLTHAGSNPGDMKVILDLNSCTCTFQNRHESPLAKYSFVLPCFFSSENDIRQLISSKDHTSYFLNQTGYLEIKEIIENLSGEISRIEEILAAEKEKGIKSREDLRTKKMQLDLLSEIKKNLFQIVSYILTRKDETKSFLSLLHAPIRRDNFNARKSKKTNKYILEYSEKVQNELNKLKHEINTEIYGFLSDKVKTIKNRYDVFLESCNNALLHQTDLETDKADLIGVLQQLSGRTDDKIVVDLLRSIDFCEFSKFRDILFTILESIYTKVDNGDNPSTILYDFADELNIAQKKYKENQIELESVGENRIKIYKENLPYLYLIRKELTKRFLVHVRWALRESKNILETILAEFNFNDEKIEVKTIFDDLKDVENSNIDYFKDLLSVRVIYEGKVVSPEMYLNSFRFKLFTLCIKISIAFAVMHAYRINFPLVMDDVFYSSDFTNRTRVKDFVTTLCALYKETFSDVLKDVPLQLIFFTHDEIIKDAAFRGMSECSKIFKVRSGRLFDYQECEEENFPDSDKKYINLLSVYS